MRKHVYRSCAVDGQPAADQEMLTDQTGAPVQSGWLYRADTENGTMQWEPAGQPG